MHKSRRNFRRERAKEPFLQLYIKSAFAKAQKTANATKLSWGFTVPLVVVVVDVVETGLVDVLASVLLEVSWLVVV